jgi:hypothetical protein
MKDNRILKLAEQFADVTFDTRGRIDISFDEIGLAAFVAAVREDCAKTCEQTGAQIWPVNGLAMQAAMAVMCANAIRRNHEQDKQAA